MTSNTLAGAVALALVLPSFSPAFAQETPATPVAVEAKPVLAALPVSAPTTTRMLPGNTEVLLSVNEELSTKRNEEGDTFYMTVVHNVVQDGFVVIPKGARATGEIIWKTGKGAFGKSGKMEIEVRYVEVGGNRIPLIGKFRQEGEGNTVATVAAVALVWVAAPFITGKTGRIPAGRELSVRTKDELAFAVPANAPVVQPTVTAVAVEAPIAATAASPALPADAPAAEPAAPAAPVTGG